MQNINSFFYRLDAAKVIAPEIDYSEYVSLDLSVNNTSIILTDLKTAHDYEIFIQNHLNSNQAKIAYGGYLEKRNLYQRSSVFNNDYSDERNIHIGLDLWINEPASIHAVLEGKIHSFQNNTALGDYGPTIILEHQVEEMIFYTLYGHLSIESLSQLTIGNIVKKGEKIANLGLPPINGDYAPHLHFQIILDIEGKTGDYPGVSSQNNLHFYKNNCPDPNELLKIY